jgi:DnaJ family protein C protein 19
MDLTILAYATLTLSLFVSAVKMGGWVLNADPRSLAHTGRWALLALVALALGTLLWLITTNRWEGAMMLAAFMLPVFVQAAPRWRALFGALNGTRGGFPPIHPDLSTPSGSSGFSSAQAPIDPDLVRQSIAVLRAYAEQAGLQIEHKPAEPRLPSPAANGSGNGRRHMSTEEALDVLGLAPTPSAQQVREAHRRLEQQLHPERGGTPYLMGKINEARDVLLGE